MKWNEEAEKSMKRVPFFVRKRVKKKIEEEASSRGADEVTLEHVKTSQDRFLNKMEDEVKGFQVESCFGSGGCPNRAFITEDFPDRIENKLVKRKLKSFLKKKVKAPLKMHHEFRVSISDCPNACSRPQIVDIGLIGACNPIVSEESCSECEECINVCREGAIKLEGGSPVIDDAKCLYCGKCIGVCPTGTLQEGQKGYRVLVGGKLGRHPKLGSEIPGIHDSEEALKLIDQCLDHYQQNCVNGERFGEVLENTGMEWINT
ncbi:4Fe-4S dicluster domain-containing protein [Thermodesulfobacteriota bacterium]